jgi:hypothetical protein
MNLGQKILEKLHARRLAENAPEIGKDVIEEENDGIHLRLEIQDFDKFSYMVKTFSVTRAQAPTANVSLKELLLRQSAEIERRITYLLEGFRLIELDETNVVAQIRSFTPHKKGEEKFYYEVLLPHGMSATFSRYRLSRQAENRELVPCHLTRETFERLVDDLAATLRLR